MKAVIVIVLIALFALAAASFEGERRGSRRWGAERRERRERDGDRKSDKPRRDRSDKKDGKKDRKSKITVDDFKSFLKVLKALKAWKKQKAAADKKGDKKSLQDRKPKSWRSEKPVAKRMQKRAVADEVEADQRNSFGMSGSYNGRNNWGVNANYGRTFSNGGNLNLGGSYQSGAGLGVNGGYQRTWNNGRTSIGANGGWSQRGGANVGVQFSHKWDEEEADKIDWDKVFEYVGKGKQIYDLIKNRDDFDEEADAEFFKKIGSWLKKNFNQENIQKGLDIYRTIKGGDDMEESDAEFFKKIGKALGKVGGIAKKGFDIYQQYGGLLRI